nr:MAG TPA: hypothetical protein [Caudoviricetes sp.]
MVVYKYKESCCVTVAREILNGNYPVNIFQVRTG